jgi:hypothetical protein
MPIEYAPNFVFKDVVIGAWSTRFEYSVKANFTPVKTSVFLDDKSFLERDLPEDLIDIDSGLIPCGAHKAQFRIKSPLGNIFTSNEVRFNKYPIVHIIFNPGALKDSAKTYVAWDLNSDGTVAHTGIGGNGNLGHSAQGGADCCRPPATPEIDVGLPDFSEHTIGVSAYGSGGNLIKPNIVYKVNVNHVNCSGI